MRLDPKAAATIILTCLLGACAQQPPRLAPRPTVATALTSCSQDLVIPPQSDGAARTSGADQQVLVVGCTLH